MRIVKNYFALFIVTLFLCMACDEGIVPVAPVGSSASGTSNVSTTQTLTLSGLPVDNGGTFKPYVIGSTTAKYGYYLYTPGGYQNTTLGYPLLIFLHGKSERGDGTSSLSALNRVLNTGVPQIINQGKWHPANPFMVVSPQDCGNTGNLNNWGGGNALNLKGFIEYMISHYRIDPKRIYVTGLSYGANGIYDYLTMMDDASSYIAAAVPIAGYGPNGGLSKCNDTPVWTFVGESDVTNFNTSLNFVKLYNAQIPAPRYKAKISAFKNAGHDVWTRTYTASGMFTADPLYSQFDQTMCTWLLKYTRP